MNPVAKELWVKALRSGEYKQGLSCLHNVDENSYCCMGVLCEVYDKEVHSLLREKIYSNIIGATIETFDKSASVFPQVVLEWSRANNFMKFITLNDRDKKSFSEIADYIETL